MSGGIFPQATSAIECAPCDSDGSTIVIVVYVFPPWLDTVVDMLTGLAQQVADAAAAVAAAVGDILDQINSTIQEIATVITGLHEFFDDSEVDAEAILHRAALYRAASDRSGFAAEAGQSTQAALGAIWAGEASEAAQARVAEWATAGTAAKSLFTNMATSTESAGAHFQQVRQIFMDEVDAAAATIQAAEPSLGEAMGAGFFGGLLAGPVGAAAAAIITWANQCLAYVATFLTELCSLAERIVLNTKPEIEAGNYQLGVLTTQGDSAHRAASILTTGVDPGPRSTPQGTSGRIDDATALALTNALEENWTDEHLPEGWSRLTDEQLRELGIDPALMSDPNGFEAGIFVNDNGTPNDPSDDYYMTVFAGTDPSTGEDILEDGIGAVTYSEQSANTQNLVDAMGEAGILDSSEFTGHSLGGRLAAVASVYSGQEATTFNAAGVSDPTYAYYAGMQGTSVEDVTASANGSVHGYQTDDDVLTGAQEEQPFSHLVPDAPGDMTQLDGQAGNELDGHQRGNITQSYNDKYGTEVPVDHPEWAPAEDEN